MPHANGGTSGSTMYTRCSGTSRARPAHVRAPGALCDLGVAPRAVAEPDRHPVALALAQPVEQEVVREVELVGNGRDAAPPSAVAVVSPVTVIGSPRAGSAARPMIVRWISLVPS